MIILSSLSPSNTLVPDSYCGLWSLLADSWMSTSTRVVSYQRMRDSRVILDSAGVVDFECWRIKVLWSILIITPEYSIIF